MSRIVVIAVCALYLVPSAGFQVLVHTCGGVTEVDPMPLSATDPCGCTDEPAGDRCCTLDLVTAKVDEARENPGSTLDLLRLDVLGDLHTEAPSLRSARLAGTVDPTPSPPIPVSRTILHCSLLI
ncbi:MAG: hypothetical protein WB626_00055 [Bacteroidota bacterium]